MPVLNRIVITQLRNLITSDITLSHKINLFYGDNGSGKTSLLEAISLLGLGKSFRTHKTRTLIHRDYDELIVYSLFSNKDKQHNLGFQANRKSVTSIKLDGDLLKSSSQLAYQLPLHIINSASFKLLEGTPKDRRQFLDWMVFHVKPEFMDLWRRFQRVLRQRNELLRNATISAAELMPWDQEFISLSEQINALRQSTLRDFIHVFSRMNQEFGDFLASIHLKFFSGWNEELGLFDCLKNDMQRDLRLGYTHQGPHRADIKISQNNELAKDVLSRGQSKMLIGCLFLCQAHLYKQVRNKTCIFLVDDLLAELDQEHANQLMHWLVQLGGQIFITGANKSPLQKLIKDENRDDTALFHVEQGSINEEPPLNKQSGN